MKSPKSLKISWQIRRTAYFKPNVTVLDFSCPKFEFRLFWVEMQMSPSTDNSVCAFEFSDEQLLVLTVPAKSHQHDNSNRKGTLLEDGIYLKFLLLSLPVH